MKSPTPSRAIGIVRMSDPSCLRLWACLISLACLGADVPGQVPRFDGTALPEPPSQRQVWVAPATSLPKFLVSATATLFDQGMADPRGCEYRSIRLGVGKPGSLDGQVVSTHGWVMPAVEGQPTRFAVAWNGLVYPVVTVGDPADLTRDAKGVADFASKGFDDFDDRHSTTRGIAPHSFAGFASFSAKDEATTVDFTKVAPIKVVILLRLGRVDLAEAVWTAGLGPRPKGDGTPPGYGVSYLTLAGDLAWNRYHRAVNAHVRRDDRLALIDARATITLEAAIEAKARAMGFSRPTQSRDGRRPAPYLGFLDQATALAADQDRRAVEPRDRKPPPAGGVGVGDKLSRIAGLIRDLDEVSFSISDGNFAQATLAQSPPVSALVAEGEAAVAPLIEALRIDRRLTRTLKPLGSPFRGRGSMVVPDQSLAIVPTSDLAHEALTQILKTRVFTLDGVPNPRDLAPEVEAEQIRAYWDRYRSVSLVERWYKTLAEDRAGPNVLLQAARSIVGDTYPPRDPRIKLPGEALREAHEPSVSALMARRVASMLRASSNPDDAEAMAFMLATWDAPSAVAPVREVFQAIRDRWDRKNGQDSRNLASTIARLSLLRSRLGDVNALGDYASWLKTTTPNVRGNQSLDFLEPVWRNPTDPSIAAAADWLFNDPKSAWVPFIDPKSPNAGYDLANLIPSPMAGVAGFRRMLIAAMLDKSPFGSAEVDAQGDLKYAMDSGWSGGTGGGKVDPLAPKPGVKVRFRTADLFAWKLSEIVGAPLFELYWPEARRDQGLAEMTAFLTRYGERLGPSRLGRSQSSFDADFPYPRAHINFPRLDHPASARELEAGLAIFTREGDRSRHLVPLPNRPIRARWLTLKDFPRLQQPIDPKVGPVTVFEQSGWVWQAESGEVNGKMGNLYGFVGPHGIAVVPEEEIEFSDWPFGGDDRLADGLDARWYGPVSADQTKPTTPVIFKLELKNRTGRYLKLPTEFVRNEPNVVSLTRGMVLTVDRAPPDLLYFQHDRPKPVWEPVTPKSQSPFVPEAAQATRTLNPAESFEAFAVDLNNLFDLKAPGLYRVTLLFTKDSGITEGTLTPRIFNLPIKPEGVEAR